METNLPDSTSPGANTLPPPIAEVRTKKNVVPVILSVFISGIVFGLGGYVLGRFGLTGIPAGSQTVDSTDGTSPSVTPAEQPSDPAELNEYDETLTFTHPATWQVFYSTTDQNFFTDRNLTGFDQFIALQNGDYYLIIGIDRKDSGANVEGIFTTDAEYQEFLKNNDEITIGGERFFVWKGDARLDSLTDPGRSAGIYGLASASKFVPEKVTNEEKKSFDGFEQYIPSTNGRSYMFFKLSAEGHDVTPGEIQSDIKKILESIQW